MRYISVCSGIEAATVAWHSLGWEPVAFAEIDAFPSAVLKHHFPDVPNLGDIRNVDWRPYHGTVDLVVGGTPCQSFSIAGRREGLDGASGLVFEYFRLLREVCPKWFVWENVPGTFSSHGGEDFRAILRDWDKLGYHVAWRVLDAQYFGVPQRRRRIFAVGHLGDWRYPAKVLFERESLRQNTPEGGKTREKVTGTLSSRTSAGGGLGTDFECAGGLQAVARCLSASNQRLDYETETFVPVAIQGASTRENPACGPQCKGYREDGKAYTLEARAEVQAVCAPVIQYGEIAGALTARHDSSPSADRGMTVVAFQQNQLGEARTGNVAGTLNTNSNASGRNTPMVCGTLAASGAGTSRPAGQGNELDFCVPTAFHASQDPCVSGNVTHPVGRNYGRECGVCVSMRVRRLTPRECERLQGFPDGWTDIPWRGKDHAPDGPRYKALGNSMCVPCMRWIGERIQQLETRVNVRAPEE